MVDEYLMVSASRRLFKKVYTLFYHNINLVPTPKSKIIDRLNAVPIVGIGYVISRTVINK